MASLLSRQSVYDAMPAGEPPVGETTNFVNPPSQSSAIYHINGIALICMFFILGCRFWVRGFVQRNVSWDDWTCATAAITSIIHSALILHDIKLKLGVHIWNIPMSFFMDPANVRLLTSVTLVYPLAIYSVKLSILLFYQRVFNNDRTLRLATRIGIVFLSLVYITYLCLQIAAVAQCSDWTAAISYPVCKNMYAVNIFQSTLNVLTDFFVLLLPVKNLFSLQLKRSLRIGLIFIMSFGLGTCILAVVRLALLATTLQQNDPWNSATISHLSEINLGIILACAPMLPDLFKRRIIETRTYTRPESMRPPPPSKETSYNPVAPPSSRIGNYATQNASPWVTPALSRSSSSSREQFVELADHSPVSPINSGRVELAAHHIDGYFEVDAMPARGVPARWVRQSRWI